ncbi:MAG: hypothetical protein RBS39_00410 [Phycisphaerales bacterium]|jgi:hypothetical protein|nr:hypothetical protein [Phycisphaerales bacterium]
MRPGHDAERIDPARSLLSGDEAAHTDPARVLGAMLLGLQQAEAERHAEQSPLGLDALDETDLHALLAQGARDAGWGCFREVFYPSVAEAFTAMDAPRLPRDSERLRADLVLTPSPDLPPLDPLLPRRAARAAEGTLFADLARQELAHQELASGPPAALCPPRDATWLEVKCTGQVAYADGVPRPNPRYASELVAGPAQDLAKLAGDPLIVHGMGVLVAFVRDERTAAHDLGVFTHRLLDRGLDIAAPVIGGIPIPDRVGNAWCAVALVPLRLASRLGG